MDLTPRLKLNKPNPDPLTGDYLDVSKLNDNFDTLDGVIGFTICASTSRPTSPFAGQAILETDTGAAQIWGGSGWLPLLTGGGAISFTRNIGIGGAADGNSLRKIKTLSSGTNGSLSQVLLQQTGSAVNSRAVSTMGGGDTQDRWMLDFDGRMQWGNGTAGADVSLWRQGTGQLSTDAWLTSRRSAGSDWAFGAFVGAEGNSRFYARADGMMNWGPGGSVADTNLYRASVGAKLQTDGAFQTGGDVSILPPQNSSSRAIAFNHAYAVYVDNTGTTPATTRLWLDGPNNGEFIIGPRSGTNNFAGIRLRTSATTSSAANAFLDASNYILKSTSSIRYKANVRDLDMDAQLLLSLRPVRFQDKREHAEQGDEARTYVGLIAEEVDALGLGEFVHYDEDGRPDGVQYDRITVGLLGIVKDLARRVEALESAIVR